MRAKGLKYDLAVYEGGPGGDITSTQGDTSLAAAVGNLDTFLYSSLQGIQQQNFFLFNFGVGPYSSHSYLWNGFWPHPAWEALQMRNQYANGDMVNITTNAVPLTTDGNNIPLISTYAFHEVTASGVNQIDVFVLSRDLNNTTPVTLRLPGVPTGSGTLYTLTGNPRTNNDAASPSPSLRPLSRASPLPINSACPRFGLSFPIPAHLLHWLRPARWPFSNIPNIPVSIRGRGRHRPKTHSHQYRLGRLNHREHRHHGRRLERLHRLQHLRHVSRRRRVLHNLRHLHALRRRQPHRHPHRDRQFREPFRRNPNCLSHRNRHRGHHTHHFHHLSGALRHRL